MPFDEIEWAMLFLQKIQEKAPKENPQEILAALIIFRLGDIEEALNNLVALEGLGKLKSREAGL